MALAREAIATYRDAGDASGAGAAEALLARVLIEFNEITPAIEVSEAALSTLPVGNDVSRARLLTSLSRALFRDDQNERSVAIADQALALAERLDLEELIAEAFTNKGAALTYLGRDRESMVLQEAAIRLAESLGLVGTQLRATNNLASSIASTSPRRAREILDEGIRLAERVGERGEGQWLRWFAGTMDLDLGDDWDGPQAVMDELLAEATTDEQARPLFFGTLFRLLRGDPEADTYLDRLTDVTAAATDASGLPAGNVARAWRALLRGDPVSATDLLLAAAAANMSVAPLALPIAAHAAAWTRDASQIRRAEAALLTATYAGPVAKTTLALVRASLAAVEGNTAEAIEQFRLVVARWAEFGTQFHCAMSALDFVITVGPDEPATRAAGEEARVVFERLRATPLLARLDAALERDAPGASALARSPGLGARVAPER